MVILLLVSNIKDGSAITTSRIIWAFKRFAIVKFLYLILYLLLRRIEMELDHVFIFTQLSKQVVNVLHQFGLTEGTPNVHPGQGTSCRRFFFENAYLEIVWVSSEEKIKSPSIIKTSLWERSQYPETNYCPFGLCFRKAYAVNQNADLIFKDGWKYTPPYLQNGTFINIASNSGYPSEPMLFEIPFFNSAPKNHPAGSQQPLNHILGFKEITKVILSLPTSVENLSTAMEQVINNSIVIMETGDAFSIALEFNNCKQGKIQSFTPLVPLTIRW
jgi:hypothetical protein